ncbi:MAG TPA: chemotaxis protein CheW [Hypericibacter adhaerens]|jgi:purine-binding chemotaxis protein CheW|uniref:chemotaxis protein CheW n=1 Tax=Hypericibacter adhaerens TaxID=2602016 RepID=UPI002CA033AC|nr:chemotaxis protein CheW [Hypericibacter adhaerens]HWA46390.1 chemotaxis protein CheW [Hypericibacter adhaerens]
MDVLVFLLSGQRYGLIGTDVDQVVRAVTMAALPRAPAIVEGVINLRGRLVPVLDIRARFNLPAKPLSAADRLIVARAGPRLVALRVEGAMDFIAIDPGLIENPASIGTRADLVAGVAKLPDGLVLIHNLRAFLSAAEADAIDALVETEAPA